MLFLIHDSGPQDPERMIIYASDESLRHLSTATEWYMDGNFKLAPNLFMQLYVIRATRVNGQYPLQDIAPSHESHESRTVVCMRFFVQTTITPCSLLSSRNATPWAYSQLLRQ